MLIFFSYFRKGGDNLEIFLDILREVLKGILREVSAYFFRKSVLENKKTTLRGHKPKGGSRES